MLVREMLLYFNTFVKEYISVSFVSKELVTIKDILESPIQVFKYWSYDKFVILYSRLI